MSYFDWHSLSVWFDISQSEWAAVNFLARIIIMIMMLGYSPALYSSNITDRVSLLNRHGQAEDGLPILEAGGREGELSARRWRRWKSRDTVRHPESTPNRTVINGIKGHYAFCMSCCFTTGSVGKLVIVHHYQTIAL